MFRYIELVGWVLVLVLSMTVSAATFDNHREGYVFGLGVGPGVTSFPGISRSGLQTDIRFGYGLSSQLQLAWMVKSAWYSDEVIESAPIPGSGRWDWYWGIVVYDYADYSKSVTGMYTFMGPSITYYFRPTSPSPYIFGGLGLSVVGYPFEEHSEQMRGYGITLGGGYEFARHWLIEGSIVTGRPEHFGVGSTVSSVKVTLNWLGY